MKGTEERTFEADSSWLCWTGSAAGDGGAVGRNADGEMALCIAAKSSTVGIPRTRSKLSERVGSPCGDATGGGTGGGVTKSDR